MHFLDAHENQYSTGYHQVGTTKYADPISAYFAATHYNLPISWHFHEHVFGNYPWQVSSGTPLLELYKQRALQLREKYDYLTLYYSGGSDSHNILKAFIDNNIKLDEVFVHWGVEVLEKFHKPNAVDKSAWNLLSEWDLVIKPGLQYLKQHHPEIKITVSDWSHKIEPVINNISEKDLFLNGIHWINMGAFVRITENSKTHQEYLEKGKPTAVILGIDKPKLLKRGNEVFVYFMDILADNYGTRRLKNVEAFYWTPDFPEIVREQSHALLNYFKNNPDQQYIIDETSLGNKSVKRLYDDISKRVVYPLWDMNLFQADKPETMFYSDHDLWIRHHYRNTNIEKNWQAAFDNIVGAIDSKYINFKDGKPVGFKALLSPFYKIGDI